MSLLLHALMILQLLWNYLHCDAQLFPEHNCSVTLRSEEPAGQELDLSRLHQRQMTFLRPLWFLGKAPLLLQQTGYCILLGVSTLTFLNNLHFKPIF